MKSELGRADFCRTNGSAAEEFQKGDAFIIGGMAHPEAEVTGFVGFSPKRHVLSIAPTRSGKGVSLIIPNLLLYAGSAIVIDPKGENAWITAPFRRQLGQKVVILDPWNEVNRRYGSLAGESETAARFNPMSILDPESPHYSDDVAYLADALIVHQAGGKDRHFDDSARELVSGLIACLVEDPELRPHASLSQMRSLLASPERLRKTAQEAQEKLGMDSLAARKLARFTGESNEIASIISTALTQTAMLDNAALAENMSASDFSFDDLVNGSATIYLVLPVDKLQTYGRWLRLMVSIAIRAIARNTRQLDNPVAFILDEFGTIGALRAVAQAYGLMAGLQMILWIFVQDLVQLRRDYPDDWETFIGNSEAVTSFSVMDQFTAKYISDALGTTTSEQISQLTANMRKGGVLTDGDPNYRRMSDQLHAIPLIRPEDIRGLGEHLGIVLRRGEPILFQGFGDPWILLANSVLESIPGNVGWVRHRD